MLIKSARTQLPSSFRLYEGGLLRLPPVVILKDLSDPVIFVEGSLGGVWSLSVGRGTELIVTEKVTRTLSSVFMASVC